MFGGFVKWYKDDDTGRFPDADQLSHDCSKVAQSDPERSGWVYTRLLMGLLVGMNTAVIRREVYDLLGGFDESMRIGEDYLFWLKISKVFEMHSLATTVALYRIHSSSAMNRVSNDNHQARLLAIAQARWGLENTDGSCIDAQDFMRRIGLAEFTHGYNHFWNGNPNIARRAFHHAIAARAMLSRSLIYLFILPLRPLLLRLRGRD